ncbi:hypothetical protein M1Q06_04225 [Planococcus sp. 11815]|uniref:hypothetical protein n=1 Tax=Planococcus sp. 11815 TaxID=2939413 RepID=UPI003DA5E381
MTNNSKRTNLVIYTVVGALIIIIISLVLTLITEGFNIFPQWLLESVIIGGFTLLGAGSGAFLAGRYTLKSVNQQIEHSEIEAERIRIETNNNALRIIDYVLEDFFVSYNFVISPFKRKSVSPEVLVRGINEFNGPISKIETLILDPDLLSKVSVEYMEEVPGKLGRKISHLKDIVRVVNLHADIFNEDQVGDIYEDLERVWQGINDVRNRIDSIINNSSI